MSSYDTSVFVNCPFDENFAPLLEAMVFCIIRAGLTPRLASERLESGENRLEKILTLIESCRYSIHDLSYARAKKKGEYLRMNMPFELGLDMGRRRAPNSEKSNKKFIIFEGAPYELKRCLSDLNGVDVEYHKNDFQLVIKKLRNFLVVEVGTSLPGATALQVEYETFQGWMIEKKISEGHTEKEATDLPTKERLDEMVIWNLVGRPIDFTH